MTHEDLDIEGPVILVPNHVNTWDPLLVAMSLRHKQVYYVASEHIFRKGLLSRLLVWMVAPIPMKKGSLGTETVRTCLRHLKAGHSVCIFSEGEQSWNGISRPVSPAIGKLVKASGASLVTYRLEGSYLSKPRWADTVRRGKVHGHPVGIYAPETLKGMTPEEIAQTVDRDIYENAWERQEKERINYKGKRLAEGLERALYLCPGCRRISTLKTSGSVLTCSCGLSITYREDGFFEPSVPFRHIAEWDEWQREALVTGDFVHGSELFSDDKVQLIEIMPDHTEIRLASGRLVQNPESIALKEYCFSLKDIDNMAMTRTHILLFSAGDRYYQMSAEPGINFRKYLEIYSAGR